MYFTRLVPDNARETACLRTDPSLLFRCDVKDKSALHSTTPLPLSCKTKWNLDHESQWLCGLWKYRGVLEAGVGEPALRTGHSLLRVHSTEGQ